MSEIQNVASLNMLNKPILLPCNHVFYNFCVEFSIHCPACQQRFTNQDFGTPVLSSTLTGQATKNIGGTAPKMNDNCPDPSPRGIESAKCSVSEELDVNYAPEVWPGSSPSSVDTKHADQHSSLGCRNEGACKIRVKSSAGDQLGIVAGGVDTKGTYHTREPKRQKKLSYGPSSAVLQNHTYSQKIVPHSDLAVSKLEDCKSTEDASIISSTAPWDASNVDGSICALCHSSKITEGTGRMLRYAGGKEVARGEAAYSKTIPVHAKCVECTPEQLNICSTSPNRPQQLVLCGSALKCSVARLAKTSGATVYKFWNPNVTHVIAATDSNGACSRIPEVLMAILNGKWVLSMASCVEATHPVNEEPYEVNLDNHGCCDDPRTGRLRASKNAPKLFHGLSFYFNGDFDSMGDAVTGRQNLEDISTTLVVYNHDNLQVCSTTAASFTLSKRAAEAEDVAKSIDAQLISRTWILESIAACQILPFSS